MLPTPAANDDGKTPEQHLEMKATKIPGGPRYMITSLAVLARAGFEQPNLLPTPGANDSTGAEGPTRWDRQERTAGATGGASLRDIRHLLPTPTGDDANNNGGPAQHERNSLPVNTVTKLVSGGAYTDPPSNGGRRSSDEPPPGQLTIGDA